ncbi:MAG: DNA-binding protein [Candidatus Euphemobacter frigidus]|nr:DNA-binding protein [Candidatus Euphemobacter frigidus]MDP8276473.1 DNA-binding protein [Candidatus Euphemobacter frigidus]
MKVFKFGNKFIIRIDRGEEILDTVKAVCKENDIKLGSIAGIGAANRVTIGLFETKTREYHSREFTGDYEIAPLFGIITTMDGEIYLHIHANICDSRHQSFGGHLSSAIVSATFEAIVTKIEGEVDRKFSDEIGLNLLSPV